jgi:adenylate kinase
VTERTTKTRKGPKLRLAVLGKPGSGKGAQCALLAEHFGLAHLSTGDMLRAAVRDGTALGREVGPFLEAGELVPDELVDAIVRDALAAPDVASRGYLLDGFPRTIAQAEALLEGAGAIDAAIDLDVPTEVVIERLGARRTCPNCGWITTVANHQKRFVPCEQCSGTAVRRADDTRVAIKRRLAIYQEQTDPLVRWFGERGALVTVDGVGSVDAVFQRIIEALAPQLHLQAS